MRVLSLLSALFIVGLSSPGAMACTQGEAKVGEGQNGQALLICHSGIAGRSFQSIQGVQLFSFFEAYKSDSEFRRRSEATVGMDFLDILHALRDDYGVIELYSEDTEGLQYLATKYSAWTGADRKKAKEKSEGTATPLNANKLEGLVSQNKTLIQQVNSGSCSRTKGNANVIKLDFRDGESVNLLPVDMVPIPGRPGRYELSFIQSYMNINFHYNTDVEKREIYIPESGDIQWVHKGSSYPISRDDGFKLYGSFATASGRTSNNCELQRVVTEVSYGSGSSPAEGQRAAQ